MRHDTSTFESVNISITVLTAYVRYVTALYRVMSVTRRLHVGYTPARLFTIRDPTGDLYLYVLGRGPVVSEDIERLDSRPARPKTRRSQDTVFHLGTPASHPRFLCLTTTSPQDTMLVLRAALCLRILKNEPRHFFRVPDAKGPKFFRLRRA